MLKAIGLRDLSSESGLGVCRVGWGRVVVCGGGHWRGTWVGLLVLRGAVRCGKCSISFFRGFFANVARILALGGGRTGRWAIILWDFIIFLIFSNFLGS